MSSATDPMTNAAVDVPTFNNLVSAVQSEAVRASTNISTLLPFRSQYADAQGKLQTLQGQYNTAVADRDTAKSAIAPLQTQVTSLTASNTDLTTQVSTLTTQNTNLSTLNSTLQGLYNTATTALKSLQSSLSTANSSVSSSTTTTATPGILFLTDQMHQFRTSDGVNWTVKYKNQSTGSGITTVYWDGSQMIAVLYDATNKIYMRLMGNTYQYTNAGAVPAPTAAQIGQTSAIPADSYFTANTPLRGQWIQPAAQIAPYPLLHVTSTGAQISHYTKDGINWTFRYTLDLGKTWSTGPAVTLYWSVADKVAMLQNPADGKAIKLSPTGYLFGENTWPDALVNGAAPGNWVTDVTSAQSAACANIPPDYTGSISAACLPAAWQKAGCTTTFDATVNPNYANQYASSPWSTVQSAFASAAAATIGTDWASSQSYARCKLSFNTDTKVPPTTWSSGPGQAVSLQAATVDGLNWQIVNVTQGNSVGTTSPSSQLQTVAYSPKDRTAWVYDQNSKVYYRIAATDIGVGSSAQGPFTQLTTSGSNASGWIDGVAAAPPSYFFYGPNATTTLVKQQIKNPADGSTIYAIQDGAYIKMKDSNGNARYVAGTLDPSFSVAIWNNASAFSNTGYLLKSCPAGSAVMC